MQFNSVQSGSFLTGAKSVVDATNEIYEATRNTGLDVTQITNQNRQSRADLKVVAERTARDTRAQSMKSAADRKIDDVKIDLYKYKKEKLRKAGLLAANMFMQQAAMQGRTADANAADRRAFNEERRRAEEARREINRRQEAADRRLLELPETSSSNTTTPSNKTETPAPSGQTQTTLPQVPTSISAKASANPAGVMSKNQVRNLAINTGFSPQAANVVVGIAGGESGRDPSNSTKRSGLYAERGEDSVGLMQINWGYHKDKGWLQKLGITNREQLFDPATNMRAAKYLYDGRGGNFQDWTVFNNGDYRQNM